jgi:ubiquinone/menaquinone biosynthesis C-methylase UbiE
MSTHDLGCGLPSWTAASIPAILTRRARTETMSHGGSDTLQAIRAVELRQVLSLLPEGARMLEIGGGDGFQASMLASAGFDVESIEVESSPCTHFDVLVYDGRTIPFGPAEFDCVYSSNVLEHVKDLAHMNSEILRVLKPGGTVVHVLPSTAWRFWTNLTHYPYVMKFALTRKHSIPTHGDLASATDVVKKRGLLGAIRRALFPGPHGEYSSSLSELYTFGTRRWKRVFREGGFDIIRVEPGGLFYTGYGLMPRASIATRQRLATFLGSATHVSVMAASRTSLAATELFDCSQKPR